MEMRANHLQHNIIRVNTQAGEYSKTDCKEWEKNICPDLVNIFNRLYFNRWLLTTVER